MGHPCKINRSPSSPAQTGQTVDCKSACKLLGSSGCLLEVIECRWPCTPAQCWRRWCRLSETLRGQDSRGETSPPQLRFWPFLEKAQIDPGQVGAPDKKGHSVKHTLQKNTCRYCNSQQDRRQVLHKAHNPCQAPPLQPVNPVQLLLRLHTAYLRPKLYERQQGDLIVGHNLFHSNETACTDALKSCNFFVPVIAHS